MDVDGTLIRLISFFQRLLVGAQEAPEGALSRNLRESTSFLQCDASPGFTFARIADILDYVTRNTRESDGF